MGPLSEAHCSAPWTLHRGEKTAKWAGRALILTPGRGGVWQHWPGGNMTSRLWPVEVLVPRERQRQQRVPAPPRHAIPATRKCRMDMEWERGPILEALVKAWGEELCCGNPSPGDTWTCCLFPEAHSQLLLFRSCCQPFAGREAAQGSSRPQDRGCPLSVAGFSHSQRFSGCRAPRESPLR